MCAFARNEEEEELFPILLLMWSAIKLTLLFSDLEK